MDLRNLEMAGEVLPHAIGNEMKRPRAPFALLGCAFRGVISIFTSTGKSLIQCALLAVMAYGCYYLVSKHMFSSVEVSGVSMMPTLQNTERLLLDRWTYLVRDPQPYDIVVIQDPEDSLFSVKRIVGSAGDSIRLKGGRVYVNNRILDEPYLAPGTPTYALLNRKGDQWIVIGKDHYFVLGDNRNNSADSRVYGAIRRENILGTVIH
jgi:signal peptidase I